MLKTLVLSVRILTVVFFGISFSGSIIKAQTASPVSSYSAGDINTGRWSNDGRYFVAQHTDMGPTDSSWTEYDTLTNQVTTSQTWPLEPKLAEMQIKDFQISEHGIAYISPSGQFIVYAATRPPSWGITRWGFPIGIADLQTNQHVITDLPVSSNTVDSLFFDVHWSGDSNTFTVSTVTDDGATFVYYVTNLNQSINGAKMLTISRSVIPGPNSLEGIQVRTETITPENVYAITFDGQKLLINALSYILIWYPSDSAKNQLIPANAGMAGINFTKQDSNQVLIVNQSYLEQYDLVRNQATVIADVSILAPETSNLTTQQKPIVLHAWIAPDGKHVAIMSGHENTDVTYINILPIYR